MAFEKCFQGKRILVTGAGRGIGRAVVAALSSHGAIVYTLSKTASNLETLKAEFPSVIPVCVDLGNWEETRNAVENLEPMDCLINNAAIAIPYGFLSIKPDEFDLFMAVNVKPIINLSQVIAKKMIADGKPGSIVNISSVIGERACAMGGLYCTSKAALEMLSKVMAIELGPHKITVNVVRLAKIETDGSYNWVKTVTEKLSAATGTEVDDGVFDDYLLSRTPTKNLHMPMEDAVNTILFYASGLTSQITGSSLNVDGGFLVS